MFSARQTAEIIDKLIELTQHNQITWESQRPTADMIGAGSRVDMVYLISYLGRNIRVYHQHVKHFLDEEYFWNDQMIVEFIDNFGAVLGQLPHTPNAWELLRAIQFQNPHVSSFYDDLLK